MTNKTIKTLGTIMLNYGDLAFIALAANASDNVVEIGSYVIPTFVGAASDFYKTRKDLKGRGYSELLSDLAGVEASAWRFFRNVTFFNAANGMYAVNDHTAVALTVGVSEIGRQIRPASRLPQFMDYIFSSQSRKEYEATK